MVDGGLYLLTYITVLTGPHRGHCFYPIESTVMYRRGHPFTELRQILYHSKAASRAFILRRTKHLQRTNSRISQKNTVGINLLTTFWFSFSFATFKVQNVHVNNISLWLLTYYQNGKVFHSLSSPIYNQSSTGRTLLWPIFTFLVQLRQSMKSKRRMLASSALPKLNRDLLRWLS